MKIEKIFWYILLSIFILILDNFGYLNVLKTPAENIVIPVKREIYSIVNNLFVFREAIWIYPRLAQILSERNEFIRQKEEINFKLDQLTQENLKLRTQLEAPFPPSYKFVPANVIAVSGSMEIDAGSNQGVRKNQIVISGDVLVGKVWDTTPRRSKVMLISDPDFSISAVSERGTKGEAVGMSSNSIGFTKILQKDPLFLGDLVVTTGEEFVPPKLLIGKISFISADETAAYKQAKVSPIIAYEREKIVFVVTTL